MKIKLLSIIMFCFSTFSFAGPMFIQLSFKDCACGFNNGQVSLIGISGGSFPYTYTWSTGSTMDTIMNLAPGVYTVYVTDALGTVDSASATVSNNNFLVGGELSYSYLSGPGYGISHPCGSQCNGIVYLNQGACNGTPPYSLFSSNINHIPGVFPPTGTPVLSGICSNDIYTATVYDANGCSGDAFATSPYPSNSFAVNYTVAPACNGISNGSISFDFYESYNFPYTINWSGPSGTGSLSQFLQYANLPNLLPGNYSITVTMSISVQPCDTGFVVNVPDLGTNCGVVSGIVYLDSTRNCLPDVNEPQIPGRLIKFTPGPYYGTTDGSGNYSTLLPYGTYTADLISPANYYPVCTGIPITLDAINDTITNLNLGDSANTDVDLSLGLYDGAARPGFDYYVYGNIQNRSIVIANASVLSLTYDPLLTISYSSLPYSVTGPGQIDVPMPSLSAFQVLNFQFRFSVPANVAIGTTILTSAVITAGQPENYLVNNSKAISRIISGSYDPNEKANFPFDGVNNNVYVDVDPSITYTIRFQNTGNDTAFNIVVIDTLDRNFNFDEFQFSGSSHPSHWELTGQNILKVYFNNIQLPDSNTNEALSHGVFSFTVPAKYPSVFPYILNNKAEIYFDFNPPVVTNTVFNTLEISVGMNETASQNSGINISPNPAHDKIIIRPESGIEIGKLEVMDMQGRTVIEIISPSMNEWLDVSKLKAGIYIVKANLKSNTGNYSGTTRLVIY